jgi:CO/xanthine dehydrogenase FAD-binding subunit
MCLAVHPSDIAPALIALNAKIVTDTRTVAAEAAVACKDLLLKTAAESLRMVF